MSNLETVKMSKSEKSWCLYDVGNSAYATSIMVFVFPIWFKDFLVGKESVMEVFGKPLYGHTIYPLIIAISLMFVFLLGPFLGKKADELGNRKIFLGFFTLTGAVSTASIGFVTKGDWVTASFLFMGANLSFVMGTIFYNALLNQVASKERYAKISGSAWAWGYTGGFVALLVHLMMVMNPSMFGISKELAPRMVMWTTAAWWVLFSIPALKNIKEAPLSKSLLELNHKKVPLLKAMSLPGIGLFLSAFFLYNDAIQTTISQAGNLAQEMVGLELKEVLTAGVVIQFLAIFGSLAFLWIEKRKSTYFALKLALIQWCFVIVWAFFLTTVIEFYILCAWVGLIMGVSQSASRTLYASLIPEGQSAGYFSLYSLADRAGAMVGPLFFALAAHFGSIRYGIIPIFFMLLIGTALLFKLKIMKERI